MKREFMVCLYFIFSINLMYSQVTIGSGIVPNKGALLDLKENDTSNGVASASKGLLLPRVNIINLMPANDFELAKSIGNTASDASYGMSEHTGLVVYNVNTVETEEKRICPGVHLWSGTEWIPVKQYPDMETKKELISKKAIDFALLNGSSDSMWEKLGENPKDYPIGLTSGIEMKDANGNSYKTRRFYVAYKAVEETFETSVNVSCTDVPKWIATETKTELSEASIIDGVWTLQNIYATQKGTGGTFTSGGQARLNPAYYFKNGAGITIPTSGIPSGGSIGYTAGTSRVTSTYLNYAKEFGLLYSWDDAIEVCAEGWHIPNNKEWSEVIIAHGGTEVAGNAMRKQTYSSYTSTDSNKNQWKAGQSGTDLGFAAVPSGDIDYLGVARYFGAQAFWWSSSSAHECWYIAGEQDGISGARDRGHYQSVRCAKD